MRIFNFFALVLFALFGSVQAHAQTPDDTSDVPYFSSLEKPEVLPKPIKLSDEQKKTLNKLLPHFVKQGVPLRALKRALEFFLFSQGRTLMAKANQDLIPVPFKNDRYIGIADYTQPSTVKRFYLLDLKTGELEKHYVAHGNKTGGKWAQSFSNEPKSLKSSLGLYLTGGLYDSKSFGNKAMKVYGLEASNDNAYLRDIVIHQAEYASPLFIERLVAENKHPRLGRSFGCFAFDPEIYSNLIEKLKNGALLYAYVRGAEKQMLESPQFQDVIRVDPSLDTVTDTEEELRQQDIGPKN